MCKWIVFIFLVIILCLAGIATVAMLIPDHTAAVESTPPVLFTIGTEVRQPTHSPIIITTTPTLTATGTRVLHNPTVYVIQPGDTFFGIAEKLDLDWQILALINGMGAPDNTIFAGDILNIPDSTKIPTPTINDGKQIIIVIGQQKVYAFEDGDLITSFPVSTGTPKDPTVLGNFKIETKLALANMSDHSTYNLINVPWTMYFYKDYGLHGTYWHENFGHPMSHGCINMRTPDAKWLFDWTPEDTAVTIIN